MTLPALTTARSRMPTNRKISLASRLTAGCVTLIIAVAAVAAGVGWWWKFRAASRERARQPPPAAETRSEPPLPPRPDA
jgi:redox-sensitive bicupin YhaK (pirin superfamily)